ncbi:MAG: type II secretion system protein [Phycisphaerae bacterium]|nr:type II secretion system protein [Phycisphaerae bacterium]
MCRSGRWRVRPAFTLIELVTVIAILGIVAVFVGGPTLSYIDSIRSRAAASRLTGDVRYIQRTALNSGLRTWIVFDIGANRYQLYIQDTAAQGTANPKTNRQPVTHPSDQSTDPVQFGTGPFANVTISSADMNDTAELEFRSSGEPYDGNEKPLTADGTITLSDGVTITIYRVGGFVERSG